MNNSTPPAVLINVFELTDGNVDDLIVRWTSVLEVMRMQPGFHSSTLHRSMDDGARFRLVNVAHWENPMAFQRAVEQPEFIKASQQMQADERFQFTATPAVYERHVEVASGEGSA